MSIREQLTSYTRVSSTLLVLWSMRSRVLKQLLWSIIMPFYTLVAIGQMPPIARGYFIPPLDIPIQLAGNFGEPRRAHFHTGLDMRTNEKEGLPIHAIASGYVSRIAVSAYGYGNVLYITHPNGYTSVYAHLQRFVPQIERLVTQIQYSNKRFETDFNPKVGEITVRQGEVVAWSGNTGGSGGPHLHFEIRDSLERPLNPLLFGYALSDHIAPTIGGLKIYPLDADRYFGEGTRVAVIPRGNSYTVATGTLRVNSSRIGLALNAWDKMDGGIHSLGIYEIQLALDGKTVFQYNTDRISFDYKRQIICEVDYPVFITEGSRSFHKCMVDPGNILPSYSQLIERGEIDISDGQRHHLHITVRDYQGNSSTLDCDVVMDMTLDRKQVKSRTYVKTLSPQLNNIYATEGFRFTASAKCLPDYIYASYERSDPTKPNIYSDVHRLDESKHHLLDYATVAVKPTTLPPSLRDKALLVWRDESGKPQARIGTWDSGMYTAKVRELGTFYIGIDSTAPTIRAINIPTGKRLMSNTLYFGIADNFVGISSYDLYIDEQWVLATHDGKSGSLAAVLPDWVTSGQHSLRLTVTDGCKNQAIYATTFTR
jgi:Peptidase family M23